MIRFFLRPYVFGISLILACVSSPAATAKTISENLGVAACSFPNHSLPEALNVLLEMGFTGVEIATFADNEKTNAPDAGPWVMVDALDDAQKTELKKLVARFRNVSIHLPYGRRIRPLAPDSAVREEALRELRRAIDDGAFLRATVANVHIFAEVGEDFKEAKPKLIALYRELGQYAQERGMRLAIETTRPFTAAEYLSLIAAIAHVNVGGTIDTGHVHFFSELSVPRMDRGSQEAILAYNDLLARLVSGLGAKLFHLHLDDVRRADWREHFVVGTGIIDWTRLNHELEAINYSGFKMLEILYYVGANDTGALLTRVFRTRTPDGAARIGLDEARRYLTRVSTQEKL